MKKIRSLFTLIAASLFAISIPAIASAASVGLEYDHMNRDMEIDNGHVIEGGVAHAITGIDNMEHERRSAFLVGSIDLTERISAYAGIGSVKNELGFDWTNGGGTEHDKISSSGDIAWKAGVKAHLTDVGSIRIGGSLEYMAYSMDGHFAVNGTDLANLFGAGASYTTSTDFSEWNAALTASTTIGRVSPYMGLTYSKVTAENDTVVNVPASGDMAAMSASLHAKAENSDNVGVVIGAGYALTKHINALIEGHFIDQTRGTASINYVF